MYIDFAQIPVFFGVLALGVICSFVGNFIGLITAALLRKLSNTDTGHGLLQSAALTMVAMQMLPVKVVIAAIAASITSYVVGSAYAATIPTILVCGGLGLSFTFLARFSKSS